MSNSISFDPSFQIAKVFIRIGMILSIMMVAVFIYLIYLASLGIFQEWEIEIESTFTELGIYTPPFFWQLSFLSLPIIGFIACFLVLLWLGKRIEIESKTEKLAV